MLSLLIPCYNEEGAINALHDKVILSMEELKVEFEVIWVNDGSTDNSMERLDSLASSDSRVKVVHLVCNQGQTTAMMAAIDYAQGDILIPLDGDLQNDPADIGRLLQKLDQGYDVVSGWRKDRKDSFIRRLASRVANLFISVLFGVHLHDYGCTLKAYRANILKNVKLYGEMHRFIPIYATWQGARVTEIPVAHHPRAMGKSKYGLMRTVKVILDMIVVYFLGKYSQKPMYIFGSFGLFGLLGSFITFLLMLYFKFFGGKSFIETPLPIVFMLFFLLGAISIFIGLISELLMRTYFESQGRPTYIVARTKNI